MKKKYVYLLLIGVLAIVLCIFATGCFLFDGSDDTPDTPDTPDDGGEEVVNLRDHRTVLIIHHDNITYDGTEKKVWAQVKYNDKVVATIEAGETHPELEVFYENNIDAGEAHITVGAKEGSTKFSGAISRTFTIHGAFVETDDFDEMQDYLATGNYQKITLTSDMEWTEKVVIPEISTVDLDGYDVVAEDIEISGRLRYGKGNDDMVVTVNGNLINEGNIYFANNADTYVYGTFTNDGDTDLAQKYSTLYVNSPILGSKPVDGNGKFYERVPVNSIFSSLEYVTAGYTGESICPAVILKSNVDTVIPTDEYTVTYADNIEVGRATVTVGMKQNSKYAFGSTILYFNIEKVVFNATTSEEAVAALLDSDHYTEVVAVSMTFSEPFTVPVGRKLTLNYNGMSYFRSDSITVNGTLVINNGVKLEITNGLNGNGTVINNGTICMSGTVETVTLNNNYLVYDVDGTIAPSATVNNNGTIYLNKETECEINNINLSKTVVRKRITADDIVADTLSFSYDGEAHAPTFSFPNATVRTEDYYCSRYLTANPDKNVSEFVEVGEYSVKFTFYERSSSSYVGEVVIPVEITYGATVVKSESELGNAMLNLNYGTVTLDADVTLYDFVRISPHQELIINEGRTVILYRRTNSSEHGGIIVAGKLTVNGTVRNDDLVSVGEYDNALTYLGDTQTNGVLVNNGAVYSNGLLNSTDNGLSGGYVVTNNGSIYERRDISDATAVNFAPDTYIYDEDIHGDTILRKPTVSLTMDGTPIPDTDYILTYIGCGTVGTATAEIKIDKESTIYFGKKLLPYTIEQGEMATGDEKKFYLALETDNGTLCVWKKITLLDDLDISGTVLPSRIVTIPAGTTVDTAGYNLVIADNYTFINYGTLILSCQRNENSAYYDVPSRIPENHGEIIGYADNARSFQALCGYCTELKVTADISAETIPDTAGVNSINIYPYIESVNIDLQGHNVNLAGLTVSCVGNVRIYSSVGKPTINALTINANSQGVTITLENLTINNFTDRSNCANLINCTTN